MKGCQISMGKYFRSLIGIIPSEWKLMPLSELAAIIDCEHKTAQASKVPTDWVSIRSSEIGMGTLDLSECKYISKKSYDEWTKRRTPKLGDVIFTREAPFGHVARVPETPKIALGQRMVLLSVQNSVSSDYLMFALLSPIMQRHIERMSVGTTSKRIDVAEIEKLPIPLPPRQEQDKIANILRIMEKQVDTTKSLETEYRTLKQGLMQHLLTRGIGHTEFKKTKVGEIPDAWTVQNLSDITDEIYRYPNFYGLEHRDDGVPVIRGEHIFRDGNISHAWSNYWYIQEEVSEKFPRTILHYGDLVMSVRGTVGRVGFVDEVLQNSQLSPNCIRISAKKTSCYPKFILYYLLSSAGQKQVSAVKTSTTIETIKAGDIKNFRIPIPSPNEQQKIISILDNVTNLGHAEHRQFEHLNYLKKGLMQVLLTGKVRVKA